MGQQPHRHVGVRLLSAVKGNRERLFQLGVAQVVQGVFHQGDQAFELLDEFLSGDIFLRKFQVAVAHLSSVREQGAEKIIGAADEVQGEVISQVAFVESGEDSM
jgi:hypothetical protein